MLLIATFPTTQTALKAEKDLKGTVPVELIPVPRQIHSDCGFCLLVGPLESEEAHRIPSLLEAGAQSLWTVTENLSPTSMRKVKHYEPYVQDS